MSITEPGIKAESQIAPPELQIVGDAGDELPVAAQDAQNDEPNAALLRVVDLLLSSSVLSEECRMGLATTFVEVLDLLPAAVRKKMGGVLVGAAFELQPRAPAQEIPPYDTRVISRRKLTYTVSTSRRDAASGGEESQISTYFVPFDERKAIPPSTLPGSTGHDMHGVHGEPLREMRVFVVDGVNGHKRRDNEPFLFFEKEMTVYPALCAHMLRAVMYEPADANAGRPGKSGAPASAESERLMGVIDELSDYQVTELALMTLAGYRIMQFHENYSPGKAERSFQKLLQWLEGVPDNEIGRIRAGELPENTRRWVAKARDAAVKRITNVRDIIAAAAEELLNYPDRRLLEQHDSTFNFSVAAKLYLQQIATTPFDPETSVIPWARTSSADRQGARTDARHAAITGYAGLLEEYAQGQIERHSARYDEAMSRSQRRIDVLNLAFVEGYTPEQIKERLGTNLHSIRRYIREFDEYLSSVLRQDLSEHKDMMGDAIDLLNEDEAYTDVGTTVFGDVGVEDIGVVVDRELESKTTDTDAPVIAAGQEDVQLTGPQPAVEEDPGKELIAEYATVLATLTTARDQEKGSALQRLQRIETAAAKAANVSQSVVRAVSIASRLSTELKRDLSPSAFSGVVDLEAYARAVFDYVDGLVKNSDLGELDKSTRLDKLVLGLHLGLPPHLSAFEKFVSLNGNRGLPTHYSNSYGWASFRDTDMQTLSQYLGMDGGSVRAHYYKAIIKLQASARRLPQ